MPEEEARPWLARGLQDNGKFDSGRKTAISTFEKSDV